MSDFHHEWPRWRRGVNETSAAADGYVAATMVRSHRRPSQQSFLRTAEDQEKAAQVEAEAWIRGYVFGAIYGRRNRWWWQRVKSQDVPPDMSRLEFVMSGVGKAGSPAARRRARLARI